LISLVPRRSAPAFVSLLFAMAEGVGGVSALVKAQVDDSAHSTPSMYDSSKDRPARRAATHGLRGHLWQLT
jgi:hypothetical protein